MTFCEVFAPFVASKTARQMSPHLTIFTAREREITKRL